MNKYDDLYTIPLQTIDGTMGDLSPYRNKVLLIANVASFCGFTAQYNKLQEMYNEYKDRNFVVLGFPCNQFLHQEPDSNQTIKEFAHSCYNVTFPLFAKIDVRGKNQSPLYRYLYEHIQKRPLKFVPWNFTKILVDANAKVLQQYPPLTSFKKIRAHIESLL